MLEHKNFKLINVLDFDAGSIPKTDTQIPFHQKAELVKYLGPDKTQKIVVYCRSNPKATRAIDWLRENGYRNINILRDGIRGWKGAGFKLEAKRE